MSDAEQRSDDRAGPEMARAPGMLMVGAAGRRCGKTTLACALVAAHKQNRPIAAAKVTTVHEGDGPCPRGKDGCGVCSSLVGPYSLTTLVTPDVEGKDTTLLIQAGARPVHWLCVRPTSLEEGVGKLTDALGGRVSLCESNSLRRVLEPDLFVITRRAGKQNVKRSCRLVWDLADAVLDFDGEVFDPPLDAFDLVEGRWTLRRNATAVVLAGGKSSRMGRDKAFLPVAGRPMIEHIIAGLRPHFSEIIISSNEPDRLAYLGLDVVPDRETGQGPMMAVASALERSKHDINFVVPCDMPHFDLALMTRLLRLARSDVDIVVPITDDGHFEPLFAVYKRAVAPVLDEALAGGERQIFGVYPDCNVLELPVGGGLTNVNTMADYEKVEDRG